MKRHSALHSFSTRLWIGAVLILPLAFPAGATTPKAQICVWQFSLASKARPDPDLSIRVAYLRDSLLPTLDMGKEQARQLRLALEKSRFQAESGISLALLQELHAYHAASGVSAHQALVPAGGAQAPAKKGFFSFFGKKPAEQNLLPKSAEIPPRNSGEFLQKFRSLIFEAQENKNAEEIFPDGKVIFSDGKIENRVAIARNSRTGEILHLLLARENPPHISDALKEDRLEAVRVLSDKADPKENRIFSGSKSDIHTLENVLNASFEEGDIVLVDPLNLPTPEQIEGVLKEARSPFHFALTQKQALLDDLTSLKQQVEEAGGIIRHTRSLEKTYLTARANLTDLQVFQKDLLSSRRLVQTQLAEVQRGLQRVKTSVDHLKQAATAFEAGMKSRQEKSPIGQATLDHLTGLQRSAQEFAEVAQIYQKALEDADQKLVEYTRTVPSLSETVGE